MNQNSITRSNKRRAVPAVLLRVDRRMAISRFGLKPQMPIWNFQISKNCLIGMLSKLSNAPKAPWISTSFSLCC